MRANVSRRRRGGPPLMFAAEIAVYYCVGSSPVIIAPVGLPSSLCKIKWAFRSRF